MRVELKTIMGQINIVDGYWVRQAAPNVLAVRDPSQRLADSAPKGDLFVLVELRGADPQNRAGSRLSRALAETIRDVYYQQSRGITVCLRQAVTTANQLLMDREPSQVDGDDQSPILAGVSVVVVLGEDVFIASAGPALTYVIANGIVTQYPEDSPWFDAIRPPAPGTPALGSGSDLEIDIFHASVSAGDTVVLGDSRLAELVPLEDMEKAVAWVDVEDTLGELARQVEGRDCTGLVIELQPWDAVVAERTASPTKPDLLSHLAGLTRGIWLGVSRAGRPDSQSAESLSHQSLGPLDRTDLALDEGRTGPGKEPAIGHWATGASKLGTQVMAATTAGLQVVLARLLPGHEAGSKSQDRPGAETGSGAEGEAPAGQQPFLSIRALRVLALLIPLLVIIIVAVAFLRKDIARENEIEFLLGQAQTRYQEALEADGEHAQNLLNETDALLGQAESLGPEGPLVDELRTSVAQTRDEAGQVERLYWVGHLRSYDNPLTQLHRVIGDGLDVYVLDAGTDQVYHHRLDDMGESLMPDEEDPVLVRRAQQVGSTVVGELIDMTWMASSETRQTSDLLVAESGGLLEYNPRWGLNASAIVGTENWPLSAAVVGYAGNLYVMSPTTGQIYRYLPGPEGYTSPPEDYFPPQTDNPLAGAVDMAIDGYIYVLYADGKIRKFEGGQPIPFEITGLDRPLNNPTAIYAAPDHVSRFIYIADAGNQRVVQLDKEGQLVRQIKPRESEAGGFNSLKSIFVDELAGKMLLLDDTSLFIANLPPSP